MKHALPRPLLLLASAAAGLLVTLTSCSTPEEEMAAQGWWTGDKVAGSPKIVIDLSRQVVRYYKGGKLVGAAPISSGREGNDTVRGSFRVIEKDADHRSSLYGSFVTPNGTIVEGDVDSRRDRPPPGTRFLGASMRSFMRITGGIGMHEGYLPGFAASHGCIRLPSRMAAIFYRATPLGTPVDIIGDAPSGHLATWLPVPHKLSREDIVIAPKQEGDTRPRARVAIAEPPPPPAPPKPKPVEKPAPLVAAKTTPAARGETRFIPARKAAERPAAPPPVVAATEARKSSWGARFGGGAAAPESKAKTAPAPEEPQRISYKPLASLDQKSSSWSLARKSSPPKPKKVPAVRGQTYILPGY